MNNETDFMWLKNTTEIRKYANIALWGAGKYCQTNLEKFIEALPTIVCILDDQCPFDSIKNIPIVRPANTDAAMDAIVLAVDKQAIAKVKDRIKNDAQFSNIDIIPWCGDEDIPPAKQQNPYKELFTRILSENINSREQQIQLSLSYRAMTDSLAIRPNFKDIEFRRFSQNGEDGILLYIFSLIEPTNRIAIEMCAGDGIECNTANLIINHGWHGVLFEGSNERVEKGVQFYKTCRDTFRLPPKFINAWITKDNINDLILDCDIKGEVDLFSLDMDGVDYWIWKELTCIYPRVVIVEYNNRWSADQSVTVPYADDFVCDGGLPDMPGYFGASLAAFTKLGCEKGYRLIGSNRENTNAFFMRNDVGADYFPEVEVKDCLSHPYAIHQHKTKYPMIKDKPVVQI